jgi:GNAT superfamily N-acetyltransferase
MVTRITLDNIGQLASAFLRFQQEFYRELPQRLKMALSSEALDEGLKNGSVVVALSEYGYVLLQTVMLNNRQSVLLHESYVQPDRRKHGYFKELVDWIHGYCLFTGITQIFMTTTTAEEAMPLKKHLGAVPISAQMVATVPTDGPLYRMTTPPVAVAAPQASVSAPEVQPSKGDEEKHATPVVSEEAIRIAMERIIALSQKIEVKGQTDDLQTPAEPPHTPVPERRGEVANGRVMIDGLPLPDDPSRL